MSTEGFAARVAAASAAWIYIPDDAASRATDEYTVVALPAEWSMPTQVYGVQPRRPVAEVVAEVGAWAREQGRDHAAWWVVPDSSDEYERFVQEHGALVEEADVFAFDLTGELPVLDLPAGVVTTVVADPDTAAVYSALNTAGWGDAPADDAAVRRWLGDDTDRVYASVDGQAVGAGGLTVVDGVGRLWGAVTLPEARHRGAYRAVMGARLRLARDRGATLALVKGRITTSGPVLRRAGFDVFAREKAYRIDV